MKAPKLKPSLQQLAFYDWIKNGSGSCILEAVAGAGKTTTLITALDLMKGKIFFGAFSKNIQLELAARVGMKLGVEISTMHSAGLKAWKKVSDRYVKTEASKVRDMFRAIVERINPLDLMFEGPVVRLVGLAKQSGFGVHTPGMTCGLDIDCETYAHWNELIDHFAVEVFDEKTGVDNRVHIIKIAIHIFKESAKVCTRVIDFDDMIWAPLNFNVSFDKYDWVLIDEAQDTNVVRRLMALRMMDPITGRLVAVGDRHQAIYGFTGADDRALDMIGDAVNAVRLPLTMSFRCPKSVVAYAKRWVSHIESTPDAPEGVVRHSTIDKLFEEVQVGDVVLCRFNAPLVKNVYQLIAKGIPARIEGRDIANGLKDLANRWKKVKDLYVFEEKLMAYLEREVKKFEEKENNKAIEAVSDKVECLRVIIDRVRAKGTVTVPPQQALLDEIDAIFGTWQTEKEAANIPVVLLSSIHKSKGREWKKVIWLTTGPSPFAKQAWEIQQEDNLCYVAVTRSMSELVMIEVPKEPMTKRTFNNVLDNLVAK